jgi:hypothetical protein
MSLVSRLARAERLTGGGKDEPRRVFVWWGAHLAESWIIRQRGGSLHFHVKIPAGDDDPGVPPPHGLEPVKSISPQPHKEIDPLRYLTPAMRAELRPHDRVVTCEVRANRRDAHLQRHLPPWKRRPSRWLADGSFELQDQDGTWRRCER